MNCDKKFETYEAEEYAERNYELETGEGIGLVVACPRPSGALLLVPVLGRTPEQREGHLRPGGVQRRRAVRDARSHGHGRCR